MVWTAPAPGSCSIESCAKMVVVEQPSEGAPSMGNSITDLSSFTTVGLDLAKHVFQVHCVDASGRVIVAKAGGQVRVSNELLRRGMTVSPFGVRSIWSRHDLTTIKHRLKALEAKMAQERFILTESQLAALEKA